MSGRQRLDHRQILYGRYCDILKSLDLDALAAHLTEIGLLTQQERDDIVSTPHSDRKKVFSKILTSREVKRFSEISSSIKQFRLGATAGVKGGNDVKKVSSSNKDVETNSTMDPFSVLFFAFISQLKSYLSKTEYEHDIPKLETVDEPSISPWALPWLNDDVPFESIREFFPAESIKGMPVTSPQSIRLSLLLEAFQQHTRKMNDMSERNQSLEHMVTDLSARIAYLEAQLSAQKGERQMEEMSGDDGCNGQTEVVDKVESLQRSYCKSEERCKQLVVVTQQWAIECEDKDKVISILETETQQLKDELDSLDKRVEKYKRYWQDNRSLPRGKDPQLEELRVELAQRRALYDQLLEAKEASEKRVIGLTEENDCLCSEVEELKDHLVELQDRLSNLQVQASMKEPAIREMSKLLKELRESKQQNIQLVKEKEEMGDKLLAYKVALEDAQQNETQLRPPPPQRAAKTQAMVTGFPSSSRRPPQPQFRQLQDDVYLCSRDPSPSRNVTRLTRRVEEDGQNNDDCSSVCSEDTLPSSDFVSKSTRDLQQRRVVKQHSFSDVKLPEGDYTRGTRYPNHSGILVAPLDDDEISISSSDLMYRTRPKYFDLNHLEPKRTDDHPAYERKCPVCEHVFLTLSADEFRSHVAVCFR